MFSAGTSAALGLPIALAGAVGYGYTGLGEPGLPPMSSGYIYLPALVGIVLTSSIFAKVGAKLAHALPALVLKRIFAVFLLAVGARFLLTNLL